ncbi:hypothetical protein H5410_041949 [Solanum commersonii]|uniref:SWIM-type domain-containing protein n=1 Tax=Solanum commersonii TaxID=4109 RepID=A0A9J5XSZ9_SOLCO|nr:hypothetical protein H5410_041949 [Solanum commersonii]
MALTIVTLQFHYGGCFVSNPTLRHVNGITSVEKINKDVDELHIMLFHKIAMELGVENVETFGCRVNKKGTFYMLNTNSDVLNFLNGLKGADFVDVYVVHPISIPLVVEEILVLPSTNVDVSSSPQQDNADVSSLHKNRVDLSSSPQIDRADVSLSQPFDENENRDLNQNQPPLVEEQSPAPRVEEHSDSDSLYDIDEIIDDLSNLDEELLQARQSNIQEQVKEKTARVNLDEIPSGPVGIDVGFEDIYKEKRGRFKGNLGGDGLYFDSSDPSSDISEDEGDPWHILGSIDGNTGNFYVKTYFSQYGLYVSKTSCRKVKLRVMNEHMGDFREEFARLYDYAEQLKTTNPGTTHGQWLIKKPRTHGLDFSSASNMIWSLQKGLHLALIDVLPNAEIRWYVKHIWANWKKDWRGEERRRKFWQVARASFEGIFKEHSKYDVVENNMCETFNSWILAPMAMDILRKNAEIADNCEVKFNGDLGFEIHDPPYKHVIDLKKKVCSCRSWQLKGIPCGHALTTIYYKDWIVDTFVDHWYKKETYLKAYNRFIQPMTNMKMWPKSDRPTIEPHKITAMPGRPGKNKRKDSDELVKKKFGKATRKGRKMKCFVCKTFGHNKKGCPTLKNVVAGTSVATSNVAAEISVASLCKLLEADQVATRPTIASSSGMRPATALASGGRPTSVTSSDVKQLSTQQSTSSAGGQKRKTSTTLRGGATLAYKKPRPKKAKTTSYGLLFGSGGIITTRSGNTDRVLHIATLSSSTPTNIDLGYKPNGLRWKIKVAITQRQLRDESYRSTQGTPSTQGTH